MLVISSAKGQADFSRMQAAAPGSRRWPWALLRRRVFAIEVLVCPRCGGPRRMLG